LAGQRRGDHTLGHVYDVVISVNEWLGFQRFITARPLGTVHHVGGIVRETGAGYHAIA
jgi:hypothetical protein